jgi:uncharacterized DUF497 family protein
MVVYEWDETKRLTNLNLHRLDFLDAGEFNWEGALVTLDDRRDYGEDRYIALGKFRSRLTVLVFALRENAIRLISWRKANSREVLFYETRIQD